MNSNGFLFILIFHIRKGNGNYMSDVIKGNITLSMENE